MIKHIFIFCTAISLQLNAAVIAFYNDFSANLSSTETLVAELKKTHKVYAAESKEQFDGLFKLHPEIDIAVLALQDQPLTTKSFPNFVTYVRNGGKTIFSDGSRGASWEAFFGFRYSGKTNKKSITVSNTAFASLIRQTSQTLYNPGYHTYSMGLVPQKTILALFENGDAASLLLENKTIVNGFLLDTDKPFAAAAARAAARASSGSILLAQITVLGNPSAVVQQQNSQPGVNASRPYGVPLDKTWYILFGMLALAASVRLLQQRGVHS